MKPMIILPPDTVSDSDVAALRENGICVITSKDPAKVKFFDPIPAVSSRTKIEDAAISLSRRLLNSTSQFNISKKDVTELYVELLIHGTPLDVSGTREEQEANEYDAAHMEEVRKMAREDARAKRHMRTKPGTDKS